VIGEDSAISLLKVIVLVQSQGGALQWREDKARMNEFAERSGSQGGKGRWAIGYKLSRPLPDMDKPWGGYFSAAV
jgi:hypothetical protein